MSDTREPSPEQPPRDPAPAPPPAWWSGPPRPQFQPGRQPGTPWPTAPDQPPQPPAGPAPVEGRPPQTPSAYGPPAYGPPANVPPDPPVRRRPWRLITGAVAVVLALVAALAGFALRDDPRPTAATQPVTTPTPSPTPSAGPTPTPTRPSTRPKAVPRPPSALQVVTRNRLYSTGRLLPSRCREPRQRPTSYAATKAYYSALLVCLNKSWYPTLRRAGARYTPPRLVVYAGVIRTPCGTERGTRGYYCGGNQAIYMPWLVDNRNYQQNEVWARVWMAHTFAHEYAHHVQQLTGIMAASWDRQRQQRTSAAALQESRRRELQASCLGNVYLGADKAWFPFRGELLTMWRFTVSHSGDEYSRPRVRDHGSRTNHAFWANRGFNSADPALCNTFTASAKATG